ncbi:MAG TPA: SCO family protein [Chthoniobacterales bacterium]
MSSHLQSYPLTRRHFGVRNTVIACAFVLVLAVAAGLLFVRKAGQPLTSEAFYGELMTSPKAAYDFHLSDQDGKPFRLGQLRGKVVLFTFGYTHCPDVCPSTLSDLAQIYRSLPEDDRARVQILFISVDPRRDQPDLLKKYMPYFDPAFIGLTGSADEIDETVAAYGAAYTLVRPQGKTSDVYYVNHSSFTYLVSPDGKWELRYLYTQLKNTKEVVADIEKCLAGIARPATASRRSRSAVL